MGTAILTFIFDRKKIATKERAASVELRMTLNRKQKYLATGVRLYKGEWKNGNVIRRGDSCEIQETLDKFMKKARQVINEMDDRVNLDEVKAMMDAKQEQVVTFLDFAQMRFEVRKYGKAEDTCERYDRFLRFLLEYGKIIHFTDITENKIIELDRHLQAKHMKAYSIWNNYHRFLNSLILDAMDEGLVKRNPYKWVHINKDPERGIKKYLTEKELNDIETCKLPTQSLERVRDLFIFQTYTCLSYIDLASLDLTKFEIKGEDTIYTGKRGKTNQEFIFLLLPKAKAILKKYNFHLPIISNMKYNDYLKMVAFAAGISKPITSHWARHTGATILLNKGVAMEVIAKILGHSSTKQTRETYAALEKKTIIREMKKLA